MSHAAKRILSIILALLIIPIASAAPPSANAAASEGDVSPALAAAEGDVSPAPAAAEGDVSPAAAEGEPYPVPTGDPDYELFKDPPRIYHSRPLWFWNVNTVASLDDEVLRTAVQNCYESGYSGFGILPFSPTGYLSQEYLHKYDVVLQECKRLGMKLDLYDENGFPSGSGANTVGGSFRDRYPNETQKVLQKSEFSVEGPVIGTLAVPESTDAIHLMAITAFNTDTFEMIDLTDNIVEPGDESPEPPAPIDFTVSSSGEFNGSYTASRAVDGNMTTRWNAADQSYASSQWIEIDFGVPITFNKTVVYEFLNRVREYRIEYFDDGQWFTAAAGTGLGGSKTDTFEAVTSNKMRLWMDPIAADSASIYEIEIYNGAQRLIPAESDDGGPRIKYDLGDGNWKIMTFTTVSNGQTFADYLDSDATKHFIEMTHEVYYDAFGDEFGGVIDMTFFDEPTMWRGTVWTDKYNEKFEAAYGFNPRQYYPALYYEAGASTAYLRNLLFGFRAELFRSGWVDTLQDWATEHGVKLTGHMDQEEIANANQASGDLMSVFKNQDIPGIDQISSYRRDSAAIKVVSSASSNWDKPQSMVEIHGAMSGVDIATLYRDVMDHYAKGINVMVPHAVWYDLSNIRYLPELSWRDPYYGPALPEYNKFTGRASYMLQGGRHVADIGVLYPSASMDTYYNFLAEYDSYNGGVRPRSELNYMDIGEILSLNLRRDFTYLHPEVINEKVSVSGNQLHLDNPVNYEDYRIMIIPGGSTISYENLLKIKSFYDAGGKVIGVSLLPYLSAEAGHDADVQAIISEMFGTTVYTASSATQFGESWRAEPETDSYWEAASRKDAWIAAAIKLPVDVSGVFLSEQTPRAESFRIQAMVEDDWRDVYTGSTIGAEGLTASFSVNTDKLRVVFDSASAAPTIKELRILDKNGQVLNMRTGVETINAAGGRSAFIPELSADALGKKLDAFAPGYDLRFSDDIPYALPGGNLSYIHKVRGATDIYYIANSSNVPINSFVDLRGGKELVLLDPHTGERSIPRYTRMTQNGEDFTRVYLDIESVKSIFLIAPSEAPDLRTISVTNPQGVNAYALINGLRYELPTGNLTLEEIGQIEIVSEDDYFTFSHWTGSVASNANPLPEALLPRLAVLEAHFKHAPSLTGEIVLRYPADSAGNFLVNGSSMTGTETLRLSSPAELILDAIAPEGKVFRYDWPNPGLIQLSGEYSIDPQFIDRESRSGNLALGKPVTSNDSYETGGAWAKALLTDGVTRGTGFTSARNYSGNVPNPPVSIEIDLQSDQMIDQIVLYPRTDVESYNNDTHYFPQDFTIELRSDDGGYVEVADIQGHADTDQAQTFSFDARSARYVRVVVSKMAARVTPSDIFRVQFAELEVYGPAAYVPASGLSVVAEKTQIAVGETIEFSAEMLPADVTDRSVSWYIHGDGNDEGNGVVGSPFYGFSDKADGIVDGQKLLLTGRKDGYVVVAARANDGSGILGYSRLLIGEADEPSLGTFITANPSARINVKVKGTYQLNISTDGASYEFVSANPAVVKVDPATGLITGVRAGSSVVTARLTDGSGLSSSVVVNVAY
ncbi:MAG: discoidin domain-containing protein [Clostridiales Family XIII bacterium]|jgi:hypothetical protein|nr:discoidin domain-containing protein [Clostridiales Family XIII bacterium]